MAETLALLGTGLGEKPVYDAVSQCSRCGYCLQACPTYVVTGREDFSGRGRNQLVRMLLERKLGRPGSASGALSSCLLCGACTAACYAHVPTADLVLEGRRMLRGDRPPWALRLLRRFLEDAPGSLAALLKAANALKRAGVSGAVSASGLLRRAGLRWLEEAERGVEEAPLEFLDEVLREDPELARPAGARWLYRASCGPNYIYPRVGLATVLVLKAGLGRGAFLESPCCGLPFYNYGDLEAARRLARRNIESAEAGFREAAENAPAVGDCSSCVAHLKSYPQLFVEDARWRARAERFSSRVRDVLEVSAGPERPRGDGAVVTYHDSCRARNAQGLAGEPRRLMRRMFGERFRELPEEWCCGGAGAFAFSQPELSDAVLRRKIARIAGVQARLVATSSTSCLLQLSHGLKKYYPDCSAAHISELLAEAPPGARHGKTTGS